jgi:hypothetical protein
MESEIVKNEVFPIVLSRIKERKDYLIDKQGFPNGHGLEGWFLVQIITTLVNTKHAVKEYRISKGPDLLLESGIEIELKGETNFVLSDIKKGLQYGTLCLFLANGSSKNTIRKLELDNDVDMIRYETFSDGLNEWIIRLIAPHKKS